MNRERIVFSERDFTQTTFDQINKKLQDQTARKNEVQSEGDYTSILHDDPAVGREIQARDAIIDRMNSILRNGNPIELRTETSFVGIGNRIKLKFDGEKEELLYRVGTSTDASMESADGIPWLSASTPLGKEIIGKNKGEQVKGGSVLATILDILAEKE